jgi:hypothetical protein
MTSSIDFPLLRRIYSKSVFDDLSNGVNNEVFNQIIKLSNLPTSKTKNSKIIDIYEKVYKIFSENYRNEYVYKNELLNQLLLIEKSSNQYKIFNEFKIGKATVDLLAINGKSIAFEIKTELDVLTRLDSQLKYYTKIFDYVYVVTHEVHIEEIKEITNNNIGIYVFKKNRLFLERVAKINKKPFDKELAFSLLRKEEYLSIIEKEFGTIPNLPNTMIYRACRPMFLSLHPDKAKKYFLNILKKRGSSISNSYNLTKIPKSIRLLNITSSLSENQLNSLSKYF